MMKLDIEQIKADLAAGRTDQRTIRQLIAEVERLQTQLANLQEMLDRLAEMRLGDILDEARQSGVEPRSVWPGE